MRLSTEIVRTPFGCTGSFDAMLAWSRGSRPNWDELREKYQGHHQEQVSAVRGAIPRRAEILYEARGYRERPEPDGGKCGEFWTVLVHDDEPLTAARPERSEGAQPGHGRG